MLRQSGKLKVLAGLLAVFALVLAACTPPEGGEGAVHTLTVDVMGDGAGTVVSDPPGIDTSDTDTADFAEGTDVTLTATAAGGSTFTAWGGACDGTAGNVCVVSMDQAQNVTATFTADEVTGPFTLTVDVTGDGSVTSDPAGIDCPGDCEEQFDEGDVVTLTANEGTDSFVGWGGACTGADATCEVTIDAATNVTATFATAGEAVDATYQVQAVTDDAEEFLADVSADFPTGSVQTQSSDLDMNFDTTFASATVIGLRFQGVDIPQGATITSASLTFTRDEAGAGTVTFTIEGQAVDNADAFEYGGTGNEANFDITGRDRTATSATWTSDSPWGTTATSSDIADVLQEIVDRGGWTAGNALALIISADASDATNYRVAVAYDADPNAAPQLNVSYIPPAE